jgi:hypothetical protein
MDLVYLTLAMKREKLTELVIDPSMEDIFEEMKLDSNKHRANRRAGNSGLELGFEIIF